MMPSTTGSFEKKPMEAISSSIPQALQRLCAAFVKDWLKSQDWNIDQQTQ